MTNLQWYPEKRKLSDLVQFDKNPRKISDESFAKLKERITKRGFHDVIKIDTANVILSGNMRKRALLDLGIEEVNVLVPSRELTPEEREKVVIESNRNDGEWDWGILKTFDEALLIDTGFQKVEIRERIGVHQEPEEDDYDAASAYENAAGAPNSARGAIYELGRQRLMCGDSTNPEDGAKLMSGKKADCVFTDPPYNVDYNYAKYEAIHGGRTTKFKDGGKIFNDDKSDEEFEAFLFACLKNAYDFTNEHCPIYVCHATKTQAQFFKAFKDAGWHFSQTVIWLKERIILALGQDYHRIYEPIIYGWKEGIPHYSNKFITNESEVWDLDRLAFEEHLDVWKLKRDKSADYRHPTQKPVRLPGRALRKSCPPDGIVLDLFGGSGSTLIAAEQAGATAYLMELDPAYCDVIKGRFEEFAKTSQHQPK